MGNYKDVIELRNQFNELSISLDDYQDKLKQITSADKKSYGIKLIGEIDRSLFYQMSKKDFIDHFKLDPTSIGKQIAEEYGETPSKLDFVFSDSDGDCFIKDVIKVFIRFYFPANTWK